MNLYIERPISTHSIGIRYQVPYKETYYNKSPKHNQIIWKYPFGLPRQTILGLNSLTDPQKVFESNNFTDPPKGLDSKL